MRGVIPENFGSVALTSQIIWPFPKFLISLIFRDPSFQVAFIPCFGKYVSQVPQTLKKKCPLKIRGNCKNTCLGGYFLKIKS